MLADNDATRRVKMYNVGESGCARLTRRTRVVPPDRRSYFVSHTHRESRAHRERTTLDRLGSRSSSPLRSRPGSHTSEYAEGRREGRSAVQSSAHLSDYLPVRSCVYLLYTINTPLSHGYGNKNRPPGPNRKFGVS